MSATAKKFEQFLPPYYLEQQPKSPPPQKGAKPPAKPWPPADPESDPAVRSARELGQYGFNLIHLIEKDYTQAITDWRTAFSEAIAAFATAVGERDQTLQQAKEESERDAAIAAAILSLVTAGSMKLLSVYLEHIVVPSIKVSQSAHQVVKRLRRPDALPAPSRFSGFQSAAFGGLVEETGKAALDQALKPSSDFPTPQAKQYQLDTPQGIENLRADFVKLIDDSAKVVYSQFTEAQKWMNGSTEFGAAWLGYGSVQSARFMILQKFESLTRNWADRWEFYGTTPLKFDRSRLAKQFERALWAAYLLPRIEASWGPYGGPKQKVAGDAITDRLKTLNVIVAETEEGRVDQANRLNLEGEPLPQTRIKGWVDTTKEMVALQSWAENYLVRVRTETARGFFQPAVGRRPARLAI
jgi:hypothetical protein